MSREEKPAENQEADQVETKPEDWVSLQMDDIEKQSEGEGTIAPPATAGGPSQGPRGERVLWAGDPASKRPFVVLEPKSGTSISRPFAKTLTDGLVLRQGSKLVHPLRWTNLEHLAVECEQDIRCVRTRPMVA